MAFEPLATIADLQARGVDVSNATLAETMLAVASAEVRGAAGSPISRATSTATLIGWGTEKIIKLPGPPIVSVQSVKEGETELVDWTHVGDSIWRGRGWGLCPGQPVRLTVHYTHGFEAVPADIVDLVCSYAIAGMKAAEEDNLGADARTVAERIDDYSVTYAQGANAVSRVMEIPNNTRLRLRARLGLSAGLAAMRS